MEFFFIVKQFNKFLLFCCSSLFARVYCLHFHNNEMTIVNSWFIEIIKAKA